MKTKRDYLREAFQVWCKMYNQPGDDWDVWFERGHWYGETRQWHGLGNSRWTERVAKYVLTFKQDGDTVEFCAGLLIKYVTERKAQEMYKTMYNAKLGKDKK